MLRYFLCLALLSSLAISYAQQGTWISGDLIVQLHADENPQSLRQEIAASAKPFVLRTARLLSARMNLYLMQVDPMEISDKEALKLVRRQSSVLLAQYNHHVETRDKPDEAIMLSPNDPNFAQQWSLENTGQSGGQSDADIDATDAWDISTGGVSALGDTIVVAVIDEGIDVNHEDLWLWTNQAEISGDGIDNDGNGYIDDLNGWNAYNQTGNLPSSVHGTHVSGIVAARGNNALGVSGVNWDTQVMFVAGSSGNEATVLEAYGYVLEQRARYNSSNGAEGAFVVATNSSFGVNFGQPSNFPIWCAMYDSLGAVGIMNAVATMNLGQDVDQVGDMPTTCTSDWIIGVTNTTDSDQKNSGSAFGLTHIDLGAPGTNILNTYPNDAYGLNTGTSMATPHVAGSIALLVAGACPAFMIQYRNDPANTALFLRQVILDGVDPISALQPLVATGGRLNVNNSLNLLLDSCMNLPTTCLPPYQLSALSNTDTTAVLFWNQFQTAQSYTIRYRPQGQTSWIDSISSTITQLALTNLNACQTYEFQVQAICNGDNSGYFATGVFTTEGCCEAPEGIELTTVTDSTATLQWQSVYGSTAYILEYRAFGLQIWQSTTLSGSVTSTEIQNLDPCTSYEVRLATQCDAIQLDFSSSVLFTTRGCGACLDLSYCSAEGSVDFEWIRAIKIGPIDTYTDANGGYGDFTDISYQLSVDSTYDITLTPGFSGPTAFDEDWRIWIDLNQDGLFDSTELLFDPPVQLNAVNGQLSFPAGTPTGATRMRIVMKFPGFGAPTVPEVCGTFEGGEVEDYCITLTAGDTVFCAVPTQLMASIIPGTDSVMLSWDDLGVGMMYDIRLNRSGLVQQFTSQQSSIKIGGLEACSDYTWEVQARCIPFGSGFSASASFTSPGCGACLDLAYCAATGQNANNEWIAGARLGSFEFSSGPDQGYGDYTNFSVLMPGDGMPLPFALWPGFSTDSKGEYWQIWVDWDQNGSFDFPNDLAFQSDSAYSDTLTGEILVQSFSGGPTRMRILMSRDSLMNPCDDPAMGEIEDYCVFVGTTGISASDLSPEVKLFPNPSSGNIRLESDAQLIRVEIFSSMGQQLDAREIASQGKYSYSLSAYPPGFYIVRVLTSEGTWTGKVLKQ